MVANTACHLVTGEREDTWKRIPKNPFSRACLVSSSSPPATKTHWTLLCLNGWSVKGVGIPPYWPRGYSLLDRWAADILTFRKSTQTMACLGAVLSRIFWYIFVSPLELCDAPTPNGPTRPGLVNSMLKEVFWACSQSVCCQSRFQLWWLGCQQSCCINMNNF